MGVTKQYLGDAVYVERNQFGDIVLTTEDGVRATNTIILEPEVLQAFDAYRAWLGTSITKENDSAKG